MDTAAQQELTVYGSWSNFEAVALDWNKIYPNIYYQLFQIGCDCDSGRKIGCGFVWNNGLLLLTWSLKPCLSCWRTAALTMTLWNIATGDLTTVQDAEKDFEERLVSYNAAQNS